MSWCVQRRSYLIQFGMAAALLYNCESAIDFFVDGSSRSSSSSYRWWWKPEQRLFQYHSSSCFVPSQAPTSQVSHQLNPIPSSFDTYPSNLPTTSSSRSFHTSVSDDDDNDSSDDENDGRKTSNIIGLHNLGNTCYLNAQIQCVYHIPLVRKLIIGNDDVVVSSSTSSSTISPAQIGLRRLFIDMNESTHGRAVTTATFCQLLDIPVYEQQDTQEFWKLLLPALQIPKLIDLYTGTYENYIVALDGSNRERRFLEPFLDLSLDVVNPSSSSTATAVSTSVMDALREQFNQPELLSVATGNGWRPSSDEPKVDAHKGYQLKRHGLPTILQLHLKRFHFDWNTETTNKINSAFTFPLTLDLSTIVAESGDDDDNDMRSNHDDCIYELQSVIVHVGEYQSGHYYSYVRPDIRTDDWYRFNDEIHTKVRFADVVHDAYGGIVSTSSSAADTKINGDEREGNRIARLFRSMFGLGGTNVNGYGFGGPKSNAYVLQYIRRRDIPKLYDMVSN